MTNDFPKISNPALRALNNAGITSLAKLSQYSEEEILELHGMGPSTIPKLRTALRAKRFSFKKKK